MKSDEEGIWGLIEGIFYRRGRKSSILPTAKSPIENFSDFSAHCFSRPENTICEHGGKSKELPENQNRLPVNFQNVQEIQYEGGGAKSIYWEKLAGNSFSKHRTESPAEKHPSRLQFTPVGIKYSYSHSIDFERRSV